MAADGAEHQLDRIYGLPLEEFTAARNEAAKELKAGGDAEAAAAIKDVAKPSRAAWVVNMLSREERKGVEALLKAGERLREMQERMVAGDADPSELREAAAAEQREIDSLLSAAKGLGDVSGQVLDRVGETLQAAAGDPELADAIRAGRLDRERRASSLGLLGSAAPAPKARQQGGSVDEDEGEERRAKREVAAARRRAERRVAAAEKSLSRAHGLSEAAEQAFRERRERVAELERDLEEARAERERLS